MANERIGARGGVAQSTPGSSARRRACAAVCLLTAACLGGPATAQATDFSGAVVAQRPVSPSSPPQRPTPQLLLTVDRADLTPGDAAVFTARVAPATPDTRYWLRIDGTAELRAVDPATPQPHQFPRTGVYQAILIAERDGQRWESPPVTVTVAMSVPDAAALRPWLAAAGLLLLGGILGGPGWRRVRRRTPPGARGFALEVRRQPQAIHSALELGRDAPPEFGLVVATDPGTQLLLAEPLEYAGDQPHPVAP